MKVRYCMMGKRFSLCIFRYILYFVSSDAIVLYNGAVFVKLSGLQCSQKELWMLKQCRLDCTYILLALHHTELYLIDYIHRLLYYVLVYHIQL